MRYEQALKIGRARAEMAAEAIRRWTGVKATAVCAVKPALGSDPRTTGKWEPVGQRNYKEIARDDGIQGRGACRIEREVHAGQGQGLGNHRRRIPGDPSLVVRRFLSGEKGADAETLVLQKIPEA